MFASLLVKLGMKLLTETFVARVTVLTLWEISKQTDSDLDDEIVKAVADGLCVKLPNEKLVP